MPGRRLRADAAARAGASSARLTPRRNVGAVVGLLVRASRRALRLVRRGCGRGVVVAGRRLRRRARARWPRCCGGSRSWSPSRTSCPARPTASSPGSPRRARCRSRAPPLPRAVVTGNPCAPRSPPSTGGRRRRRRAPGARARPADRPHGSCSSPAARSARGGSTTPSLAPGRAVGATATTSPSATSSAAATGTTIARRGPADRAPARATTPSRYEDDMPAALAAADLAVCRSGLGTCFELAAVGPAGGPRAAADVTARPPDRATPSALVDAGGAVLVPDAELDADRLAAEVDAAARRRRPPGRDGDGQAAPGPPRRRRPTPPRPSLEALRRASAPTARRRSTWPAPLRASTSSASAAPG